MAWKVEGSNLKGEVSIQKQQEAYSYHAISLVQFGFQHRGRLIIKTANKKKNCK